MSRRSLTVFLVLIVVLQFGYPVTEQGPVLAALYMPLWAVMLVVGVVIARAEQQSIVPYVALGAVFTVSGVTVALDPGNTVASVGMYGSAAVFVSGLVLALLRAIFERRATQGVDLVLAAVCVYLLLGALFVGLNGIVVTLDPASLTDPVHPDGPLGWQQLIYYSYVTLASLGYGEILPVSPWARSLAVLETVTGALFLATVIARLVGIYGPTSSAVEDTDEVVSR